VLRAVHPLTGPFAVTLELPGSKSIANRALVCAALADGASQLTNVPDGDDTAALIDCLRALGIAITPAGPDMTVHGTGGRLRSGPVTLDCRLAGTTSRFITAFAALGRGPYRIDGAPPLRARPMAPLHGALRALGARLADEGAAGHLPVVVSGGDVRGATLTLAGDVSSQFLTALMLIAPRLAGGVRIELTTALVSRPYVRMTAALMKAFGVDGAEVADRHVVVPEAAYRPTELAVEPDASSASYLAAAAAIGPAGSSVHITRLGCSSLQGDTRFFDLLGAMGAEVKHGETGTTITGTGGLLGIDADLADCSDTVPTLAVVAAFAEGPSRVRGVGFIRRKESDRIGAIAAELRRLGAGVDEHDDGVTVHPAPLHAARIRTYDDHRMAMAFALAGLRVPGVEIEDPAVVTKSFPGFWQAIDTLRRAVGSADR
jgi:3-phosphoshikimate 1-carboxyvinyltransferase